MTVSNLGEDYELGGGFIKPNDEVILFDKFSNPGDIVIFDAACIYGVEPVDPLEVFTFNDNLGRSALFVTIFDKKRAKT